MSNRFRFIDIGANLIDSMFNGIYHGKTLHPGDLERVLQRSKSAGVEKIIITAGNLEESKEALELISKYENESTPKLFTTAGVHPTRCGVFDAKNKHHMTPDQYCDALIAHVNQNRDRIVCAGELGLDYDRLHFCGKETQRKYFALQMRLSRESKLPLFLHNRNTAGEMIEFLRQHRDDIPGGGVVHSFDGTVEELEVLLQLGFYIGINGCSLKTSEQLAVIPFIPSDRLLLETDAPWCGVKKSHAGHKWINGGGGSASNSPSSAPPAKQGGGKPRGGPNAPAKPVPATPSPDQLQQPQQQSASTAPDFVIPEGVKPDRWRSDATVRDRNEPCMIRNVFDVVCGARGIAPDAHEERFALAEEIYKNTERLFFSSH